MSVFLVERIVDMGDLDVEEQLVFDLAERWEQRLVVIEEWRIKFWKGANRWISPSIHLESYPRSSKFRIFSVSFCLFEPTERRIREKRGVLRGDWGLFVHSKLMNNFS